MTTEWQPIETAPTDGTTVDLWLIDQGGNGYRETDAYFVVGREYETRAWNGRSVSWERQTVKRDGWWAPGWGQDGDDGWCDEPEYFNSHPRQMKKFFTKPTHWMPIPAAP